MPSRSSSEGGYVSTVGFGHEEWNFQFEDAVDGEVYGYLYYIPAAGIVREANGEFEIGFWGLEPRTRERLLVGIYSDARLSSPEDSRKIYRELTRRGIYDRRIDEVTDVVHDINPDDVLKELVKTVQDGGMRFKCAVESAHPLASPIPLADLVGDVKVGAYFTTPTYVPGLESLGMK